MAVASSGTRVGQRRRTARTRSGPHQAKDLAVRALRERKGCHDLGGHIRRGHHGVPGPPALP
jgi:hypothetical protein